MDKLPCGMLYWVHCKQQRSLTKRGPKF